MYESHCDPYQDGTATNQSRDFLDAHDRHLLPPLRQWTDDVGLHFRPTHAPTNGQPILRCLRIREADCQHRSEGCVLVIDCVPASFEHRYGARTAKRRVMLNYPPANTTGSHSRIKGVVTARPRPL